MSQFKIETPCSLLVRHHPNYCVDIACSHHSFDVNIEEPYIQQSYNMVSGPLMGLQLPAPPGFFILSSNRRAELDTACGDAT